MTSFTLGQKTWRYTKLLAAVVFNWWVFTSFEWYVGICTSVGSFYFLFFAWDRFYEIFSKDSAEIMWGAYDPAYVPDGPLTIAGILATIAYMIAIGVASDAAAAFTMPPWYVSFLLLPTMLMCPILHIIALFRFWAEKYN